MPTMNDIRESERVPFAVPITLSGRDASGCEFTELSHTKIISKYGALISTSHKLLPGSKIHMENRALARSAAATVVWSANGGSPDVPYEAGVKVEEGPYLWPLGFPGGIRPGGTPSKSNGEAAGIPVAAKASEAVKVEDPPASLGPQSTGRASAAPPAARAAGLSVVRTSEGSTVVDFSPVASRNLPEVPGTAALADACLPLEPPAPQFLTAALERFARQVDETSTRRFKVFDEKLTALADQTCSQLQARLQVAGKRLEEGIASSIGRRFRALAQGLQASEGEIRALMASLEEFRQGGQAEADRIRKAIRDAGRQALQDGLERMEEGLQRELQTASASLIEQARRRIQEETSASVHALTKEAAATLSARQAEAMEQAEAQIQQAMQGVQEAQRVIQEQLASSMKQLDDNGGTALETGDEQIKADAKEVLAETERQLHLMSRATLDSLTAQSQSAVGEFGRVLCERSRVLQEKSAREVESHLQQELEKRLGGVETNLQERIENLSERLLEELSDRAVAILGEVSCAAEQKAESRCRVPRPLVPAAAEFRHGI